MLSLTLAIACAPTPVATVAADDAEGARTRARIDALEERVRVLEQAERAPPPTVATPMPGWSCMARCGTRDTQTTAFRVSYHRVTSHGESAAGAYQALIDACDGTLYERIEAESFVGGDMRNVCMPDAGAH
ncbi:MAG TPA: hypothetical protein VG755_30270 [Nannocystaceae bacterium]|nr:hypothetical protein [Nannocystaceae bacterium]